MELIRLKDDKDRRFAPAMTLYGESFPLHEQRLPKAQRRVMGHQDYHFDLVCEGETVLGLLLYWAQADYLYVEHFCMSPAVRGQGLGAQALALLAASGRTILLEIDPPADEISVRRRGFYLRAGYVENAFSHVHPPYRPGNLGHRLVVLSRPDKLTADGYAAFAAYLTHTVMGEALS